MTYKILHKKIREIGRKINTPEKYYPDFKESRELAYPHIEIGFPYYYWVVVERGEELERKKFINVNDLLYKIFEHITFELASQYEVYHRVTEQDFRRVLFSYQLELMSKLNKRWRNKLEQEIEQILKKNPYNDKFADL